ncbi:MAG: VanW family protein [bacterium]|nr:VanW family protein [bacterium]
MNKKKIIIIILSIIVLGISASIITLNVLTHVDENSICENVYIDTLNIGSMTKEQAKEALDAYVGQLKETKVTITINGKEVNTTLDKLGLTVDEQNYIDEAMDAGKTGSLVKRYLDLRKIKSEKLVFTLAFTMNENNIDKVMKKCQKYDIDPKNSVLTREDGKFVATESESGIVLSAEKTKQALNEAIKNWNRTDAITLEAVVEETEAKITKEKALLCDTILGTFSTSYASSSANRKMNVENGAARIDGTVLYPGEEFSASTAMGPYEESNGYALAGSYSNGKTVESFGGGVCQVSTTLYNALLLAEMDITERFNHSMTVSYVKPSMDAAISGNYKDLKFKNNTDAPVYVQAYTSGGRLHFTIWGHETRAKNRKVEYVSEVTSYIEPGNDVITEDPTKPTTYHKVESNAHQGCKASLYKVVYIDGVEQSREQVNFSSYAAAPNYITVGTMEEKKEEENTSENEATPAPEATAAPEATDKPVINPEITKAPQATKAPVVSEAPKATVSPSATPKPTNKAQ